ncbi:MAG: hypothetical protein H5T84_11360, partial [Thermoleophilia bacterium]|nr:hypothetical protein [Thermoleophilia bacterium]
MKKWTSLRSGPLSDKRLWAKGRLRLSWMVAALLVAILVAGGLAGCGTAVLSAVPLQYNFKVGDSHTYEATLVMNGNVAAPGMTNTSEGAIPKDTTIKMRVSSTVKAVADGVATVEYKYEILEATAAGQSMDLGSERAKQMTVKMDQAGRVLAVESPESSELSIFGDSGLPIDTSDLTGLNPLFPSNGKAKVGEEWSQTATIPLAGTGQEVKATVKAKLTALTTENGREIATVDYSLNMPVDLTLDLGEMLKQMAQGMGSTNTGDVNFKMSMKGTV